MQNIKYGLGSRMVIKISGETGVITGVNQSAEHVRYCLQYKAADGRAVDAFFDQDMIVPLHEFVETADDGSTSDLPPHNPPPTDNDFGSEVGAAVMISASGELGIVAARAVALDQPPRSYIRYVDVHGAYGERWIDNTELSFV